MSDEDFKSLSDERLIKMTKESQSSPDNVKASIELHRRQKQFEDKNILLQDKNISLQKWILRFSILAVIIAAITLFFVIIQYSQSPIKTINHQDQTNLNTAKTTNDIK